LTKKNQTQNPETDKHPAATVWNLDILALLRPTCLWPGRTCVQLWGLAWVSQPVSSGVDTGPYLLSCLGALWFTLLFKGLCI